jgi:hypothetical protein
LLLEDEFFASGVAQFLIEHRRRLAEADDPKLFHDRLRKSLKSACLRAGVPVVSPYTLRHVGMSIAKGSMSAVEVAYSAGHKTDRTAGERYARSRKSKGKLPDPSEAFSVIATDTAVIKRTGRVTRAENMQKKAHQTSLRPR